MSATNHTTHYEMSQYVSSDKPTYLVDYNQDMSKIDTAIYNAMSKAGINETNIGTLSSLTTTEKSSIVGAINEVNGDIGSLSSLTTTANTDIVSAVNEVNAETSTIGDVNNLNTSNKSSVVSAINEVNSNVGNLNNLTTQSTSSLVNAVNEVNGKITSALPVGSIFDYAGSTAPNGYLLCQGQAVSRTTYANLFLAIGTTYGIGDGSTTFNLPNYKGKVAVGLDSNDAQFNTLGQTGGSKDLQEHSHDYRPNAQEIVVGEQTVYTVGQGEYGFGNPAVHLTSTQPAGTGNAGNLQPYIVINKIIKY